MVSSLEAFLQLPIPWFSTGSGLFERFLPIGRFTSASVGIVGSVGLLTGVDAFLRTTKLFSR